MPVYSLVPSTAGFTFIAPNATVVGDVVVGSQVYIGHGAVLRGDINSITYSWSKIESSGMYI